MGKWSTPQIECECGMTVRLLRAHKRGVFHRQHRRILSLLQHPCISVADIARRVGCTNERIRQIQIQIKQPTGEERRAVCTFNKRQQRYFARVQAHTNHPYLRELASICSARNFSFEVLPPVWKHRQGGALKVVKINGHLCSVQTAYVHTQDYHSIRISRPTIMREFALYRWADCWFVFPASTAKKIKRSTCFSLINRGGNYWRSRIPFLSYKDAWNLLEAA